MLILFCFVGVYSLNKQCLGNRDHAPVRDHRICAQEDELPAGAVLLAMVLTNMLETSFRQSMAISRGELGIFFERPFSAVLMIAFILVMIATAFIGFRKKIALQIKGAK